MKKNKIFGERTVLVNHLVLDSGDYGALQDSGLSVQKTGIQGEQRN